MNEIKIDAAGTATFVAYISATFFCIYKGTGSAKRAEGAGQAPEGSCGWATMHGIFRMPYLLDTGATSSIIPEVMLCQLTTLVSYRIVSTRLRRLT